MHDRIRMHHSCVIAMQIPGAYIYTIMQDDGIIDTSYKLTVYMQL